MDTENINPSTYLGFGTWVLWGSGRVPVGVDTSQTEFNTVEKTGGEKSHKLTVSEIPSHTHTFTANSHTHTLNNHTHTVPAHSHRLNSHTHSVNITSGSSGAHEHYGLFYSDGRTIAMIRASGDTTGVGMQWQGDAKIYGSTSINTGNTGIHNHTVSGTTGASNGSTANSSSLTTGTSNVNTSSTTITGSNSSIGGNGSHNNLQPYITCYMWKRTA